MTKEEILRQFVKAYYADLSEISVTLFLEKYLKK